MIGENGAEAIVPLEHNTEWINKVAAQINDEGNDDVVKAIEAGAAQLEGMSADSVYFGTYQQSSDGAGGFNIDPIKWDVLANSDGKKSTGRQE